MPNASLSTPTGPISMAYEICTPQSAYAKNIIPSLPTIVFIHGLYIAGLIFEPQASDPLLRKYNLVFMDLRAHGDTVGRPGDNYTPTRTADDVYRLMKHLKLPRVHLFGLSIGASAALELASEHPDRLLSLTLLSPLPLREPPIALSGREEIWDCFFSATKNGPEGVDDDAMKDCVYGTLQMIVNNTSNQRLEALSAVSLPKLAEKWAFTPENWKDGNGIICDWFMNRKELTPDQVSKVKCPVQLIFCADDLPYPPREYGHETETLFRTAKVAFTAHTVPGPHYGNFMNPEPINDLLDEFVSETDPRPGSDLTKSESAPMVTPWTKDLEVNGYYLPESNEDDDDDDYDSDMEVSDFAKRIR